MMTSHGSFISATGRSSALAPRVPCTHLRRSSCPARRRCPRGLVSQRPRSQAQTRSVAGGHEGGGLQSKQASSPDVVSPFFEPLCRTFVLGISCGIIMETAHMLFTLASFAQYKAINVWSIIASSPEDAPLFLGDHVIAVAAWMVFYAMESAGVMRSVRSLGTPSLGSEEAADNAFTRFMTSLPKKMLPLKLTLFRTLWLKSPYFRPSAPPASVNAFVVTPTYERNDAGEYVVSRPPTVNVPALPPPTDSRPVARTRTGTAPPTDAVVKPRAPRVGLKPGEWNPDLGDIAVRERDRINRQSYMQNFWYCIMSNVADTLPVGKLQEVEVMGKSVALWMGKDGQVRALSNICTHRGAQLVKGWIDNVKGEEVVRCPYHAWGFAGDGCVKHIPVQPDGRFPKRPLQETFVTRVVDGNLWLFWGNSAIPDEVKSPVPASLQSLPDLHRVHRAANTLQPHWLVFEKLMLKQRVANIARAFLGFTDVTFTDPITELTPPSAQQPADAASPAEPHDALTIPRDAAVKTSKFLMHVGNRQLNMLYHGGAPAIVPVTVEVQLPSSVSITFHLGDGRTLALDSHVRPATFTSCSVHHSLARNFSLWPGSDAVAREVLANYVEGERAVAEGAPMPKVWRLPASRLHRAFNDLRQEYISLGYGVPPEVAIQLHRSDR